MIFKLGPPRHDVDFVKPKDVWDSQPIGFTQVVRVHQPGAIEWVAGQGPHDLASG